MTGPADAPALRRLVESYALAADRRDGALFARQFTQDGVLVAPRGTFTGRAELATVPALLDRYFSPLPHFPKGLRNVMLEPPAGDGTRLVSTFLRLLVA
jgi:hypothetical protein